MKRKTNLISLLLLAVSLCIAPVFTGLAQSGNNGNAPRNNEPQDPCEQALTPPGNANGLHKRCDAVGIGGGAAKGDFNGDGFADLAVGVPYEDEDGVNAVGGVNIIYGSSAGLSATADQNLNETTFGFPFHSNDHFGWALAAGDFNGDLKSDLAISMPDYESDFDARNNNLNQGALFLIDGSSSGLDTSTTRSLGSLDGKGGRQGAALVWADFNGDGFGDLAVGLPDAKAKADGLACSPASFDVTNSGEVQVYYGSMQGLGQFGAQIFRQGSCNYTDGIGIGDSPEDGDHFGSSLAALNGGSFADLVIGTPNEDLALFDKQDAGMVQLIKGFGDGLGLHAEFNQTITQDTPGVGGAAESNDQFGRVLATGDFDGSGGADLVVGIPFEDLLDNTAADGGAIQVFFHGVGTQIVSPSGSQFISQSNLPSVGVEAGDRFGWALAVGDFDSDNRADIAVGSPGENLGSIADAGLVTILYGSSTGPSLTRVQHWTQDSTSVLDVAEPGDQFGYALSSWNYGKTSHADLAIGAPFEDVVSATTGTLQLDAGAVNVLYGSSTGLSATGNQFWTQDSPNINGTAQPGDRFGNSLY
jgi:hypothetical protein